MQIEIKLDENQNETKIIIVTKEVTQEISELIKNLSADSASKIITGFFNNSVEILQPQEIFRCYSENQKVYAVTSKGVYVVRLRLYELEEKLDKTSFVRISNSEIVNLNKVKNFDLSFSGTICVKMLNGDSAFVSRRYVSKIKNILGI